MTHLHPCLPVRLGSVHATWHIRSLTHRTDRTRRTCRARGPSRCTSTRPRHSLILLTQGRIPASQDGASGNFLGCGRRVWIGHGAKAPTARVQHQRSSAGGRCLTVRTCWPDRARCCTQRRAHSGRQRSWVSCSGAGGRGGRRGTSCCRRWVEEWRRARCGWRRARRAVRGWRWMWWLSGSVWWRGGRCVGGWRCV